MLVSHAAWHGAALCLWAELPAAGSAPEAAGPGRRPAGPSAHPYATRDLTGTSYEPLLRDAPRIELTMLLPTLGDRPLHSEDGAGGAAAELRAWRVPAVVLDPFAAMALLRHAEQAADIVAGADLRYLAVVADEAGGLVRRGRVLPTLLREDGDVVARWSPVLSDAERFRRLARAMPGACRAVVDGPGTEAGRPASTVLKEMLAGFADTIVRGTVAHPMLPPRKGRAPDPLPLAERWAGALTGPDPLVRIESGDEPHGLGELAAELTAWAASATAPTGPMRVCFRLTEPGRPDADERDGIAEPDAGAHDETDGPRVRPEHDGGQHDGGDPSREGGSRVRRGHDGWRVEFALQGRDDPSLYVPAAAIWDGTASSVADAEETLLAGLGRALRLLPDLATALREPAPAELRTDAAGAHRFLRESAPLLAAAGFGVLLPQWAGRARLGLRLTTRDRPDPGAAVASGFGLDTMVDFRWDLALGDQTIDEDELAELARLKAPLVRLRGRWVELDDEQLAAALEFMSRPRTGAMSGAQAVRAVIHAGTEDLPLVGVEADGILGDLLSGEADRRLVPAVTPPGFNGVLRPFQERGLAWLVFLESLGLGGILADSMGLGKTAQALALLARERSAEAGDHTVTAPPTLLIGPMSLIGNWQREAAKFTPKLRVYVHHGGGRHRDEALHEAVAAADLVLTTYGTATRDAAMLAGIDWGRVICDEAQALKNSGTRQARAVRSIPARSRIALTGTPVENHLTELWSIMEFANPGLLGPVQSFRDRFAIPIEERGDETAAAELRRATGPFVLRRLKTDKSIIDDLPDKQEIKVYCNLTREQASLYQATLDDMLARIAESDPAKRRGLVLATMARLKQACNHPAHLLKDGSRLPGRSGKLDRLEEICSEVLEQGEKALLFTQYTEFGSLLQPHLADRVGRPVRWLHGGTGRRGRDELVQAFQDDPEPSLFLLSLKAAGTGLNLTAASHVVHIDRWWNPAVEDQATDRAFRIGQTKNVQIRKLICVGTLEERIDDMIERKKSLADKIVGTGEDWLTELSVAELRDVLQLSAEAVSD